MKQTRRAVLVVRAALVGLSLKARAPHRRRVRQRRRASSAIAIRDRAPVRAAADARFAIPVVIVGGGMAGLTAAWRLEKTRLQRFRVLEMGAQRRRQLALGRERDDQRYPWAAHYVPVPGQARDLCARTVRRARRAEAGRQMGGALSLLRSAGAAVSPRPLAGRDRAGGRPDGRRSRAVPPFRRRSPTNCARGPVHRAAGRAVQRDRPLDRISFATWLGAERFDSSRLLWYANYACRDDYGALADRHVRVGRHPLFRVARDGGEGAAHLAGRQRLDRQAAAGAGRQRSSARDRRCARSCATARRSASAPAIPSIAADAVIFAAPTFLAPYLVDGMTPLRHFEYSPWMTANLTLETIPDLDRGEPAWDNVVMNSPALGYVDAMHQSLRTFADRTVWTFYWALAGRLAVRQPPDHGREGLGLLERGDPHRPGARASADPGVRVASGRDARSATPWCGRPSARCFRRSANS